ncbi:MAG: hypothetical protein F2630_01425 [Actinobacteria bacterium]|jgi:hypothetical protein|nr:hypothetical protein [Actinomycetota bacterium]
MTDRGACPDCGEHLETPSVSGRLAPEELDLKKLAGLDGEKIPWHFKLLVSLLCLYLGWRVVVIFV